MPGSRSREKEWVVVIGHGVRLGTQLLIEGRQTVRIAVALESESRPGSWRRVVCLEKDGVWFTGGAQGRG